ncbi:MAG: DUF1573 domain-containing protein [Verrucomicrobia bacterium]|nr:DUF1573 domain-containing protein [Verrucomicrobiota bacterium]
MKHFAFVAALAAGIVPLAVAQPTPPAPAVVRPPARAAQPAIQPAANSDARIQFAELEKDFGRVEHGAVVKHDFVFTNIGTSTLEITDVRPGCGCTTAGAWDRRVEPGQTGRIPLQLNTTGFSGSITKTATITCNAANQSHLYLQLKAQIWKPVDINPTSAYFNLTADTTTNEVRTIRIVNHLDTPLVLSEPECTNQVFAAKLTTVQPGKEFDLEVSVKPPFNWAYANGTVVIKTSATNLPAISVPVYARLQPIITTVPTQISLAPGPLRMAARPTVTIRNTGTRPAVLSEPTINLEGAKVTLNEVQPGRVFTLAFDFPAGLQIPPNQRVEARVKSDLPQFPTIVVPVVQSVATVAPPSPVSAPPPPTVRSVPEPPPYLARPRETPPVP